VSCRVESINHVVRVSIVESLLRASDRSSKGEVDQHDRRSEVRSVTRDRLQLGYKGTRGLQDREDAPLGRVEPMARPTGDGEGRSDGGEGGIMETMIHA